MPRLTPVSRTDLIRKLRNLGFELVSGSDHDFMEKGDVLVKVPNPHGSDIGVPLLSRILRDSGISRNEWFSV